jgi:hypothetical protein
MAKDCLVGVSLAKHTNEIEYTHAYSVFQTEAQQLKSDYEPQTVTTDGWQATQNAWQMLFPQIRIEEICRQTLHTGQVGRPQLILKEGIKVRFKNFGKSNSQKMDKNPEISNSKARTSLDDSIFRQ